MHWVSLRQTLVCTPRLLRLLHPILLRQPVNIVFEFVTARDSGRLPANACEADVPAGFWRRVYNIGGGQACLAGHPEYLDGVLGALGLGPLAKLPERRRSVLENSQCQWLLDSDTLESHLRFQRDDMGEYLTRLASAAPDT